MCVISFTAIISVLVLRVGGSEVDVRNLPFCTPSSEVICERNDTHCGVWKNRYFYPNSCRIRDITTADARKCLGDRTLAFIGDSIIRDIGTGVGLFLMGQTIEGSSEHKFDKIEESVSKNATLIGHFKGYSEVYF
jgi:hypothetical protein